MMTPPPSRPAAPSSRANPVSRISSPASTTAAATTASAARCWNCALALRSSCRCVRNSSADPPFTAIPAATTAMTIPAATGCGWISRRTASTPIAPIRSAGSRRCPAPPGWSCGPSRRSAGRWADGTAAEPGRAPGEQQRQHIAQVVRRIGHQRDGPGQEAKGDLHRHERRIDECAGCKRGIDPLRRNTMVVACAVSVCVARVRAALMRRMGVISMRAHGGGVSRRCAPEQASGEPGVRPGSAGVCVANNRQVMGFADCAAHVPCSCRDLERAH